MKNKKLRDNLFFSAVLIMSTGTGLLMKFSFRNNVLGIIVFVVTLLIMLSFLNKDEDNDDEDIN